MKKIYILTAVLALLTLSLNAQKGITPVKYTAVNKTQNVHKKSKVSATSAPTMDELLAGIKGLSSILPSKNPYSTSSSEGPSRVPMRINSDEETVGPFEGDNFSTNGIGFPTAYGTNPQRMYITADLDREEFVSHNGDEILGFRFALAGSPSQTVTLYDFIAYPFSASGFDQNHLYDWDISSFSPAQTITSSKTVANTTTSTNQYLPIYGYWYDSPQKNQMIYSADMLGLSAGTQITSLTFYASSIYFSGGSVTVSLGNTTTSTFSSTSFITPSDLTQVAQVVASNASTTWTINFTTPFTYTGGNLLVQMESTAGSWGSSQSYFYGDAQEDYTGLSSYSSYTPTRQAFLPRATFGYTYSGAPGYITLNAGQWYEYYLDEPEEFVVSSDAITGLRMGYSYYQYPSGSSELMYPIAVNPESTSHEHTSYMYAPVTSNDLSIVIPGNTVNITSISVYDTSNNLLTSWNSSSTNTSTTSTSSGGTATYYIMPEGWTVENAYMFQHASGSSYYGYVSSSSAVTITIDNEILNGNTAVNLVIQAFDDNGGVTVTANGVGKTITTSTSGSYTWSNLSLQSTSYQRKWWSQDFSQYGDLAVQLIFKEGKTPAPTITGQVDPNNENNYVITATGDGTVTLTIGDQTVTGTGSASITVPRTDVDQIVTATATAQDGDKPESNPTVEDITVPKLVTPSPTISATDNGDGTYTITATGNGTVTLNIEGYETATGTGSASITVPRTDVDQTITATATAQESGKAVSESTVETVTIPALPKTESPTISYVDNGDGTITITATGDGTVSLTVFGQTVTGEGTASITIVRSIEDQTVTATATAVEPNHLVSDPTTEAINVPALSGDAAEPLDGLLRMHLLVVDQFKEGIPDDNSHPDRYGYVLKWEPNGPQGSGIKESGTVEVEIQKTEAQVNGYYTLTQVKNDIDHDNSEIELNVLTADVSMDLPGENPDVLYYQMQGAKDANPALGADYLTQLQYMKNVQKYEEMLETSPNKTHQYNANETYHYFDDSTPIVTGDYGVNFITYAPSVSTWGIQRRYFESDGLDNTYGAPIWKTGVGQVRVRHTEAQLQRGPQGSTQWDGVGGPCSLVFLGVEAFGDLPSTDVSNILYEPYMFRVWVQSPGNNLRGCNLIAEGVDPEKPGEHWDGDGTSYGAEPVLVYQGLTNDGVLYKHVQPEDEGNNVEWGEKIQFGALDAGISDLIVYVRFYYRSTGKGISNINSRYLSLRGENDGDGDGDDNTPEVPYYYASEGKDNPNVTTGINGVYTDLSKPVESVTYVNAQGMQSSKPFDGVNLVITRYTDGTTSTKKVVR